MTVAELREELANQDPDNLVEIHLIHDGLDRCLRVQELTSCDIASTTWLSAEGGGL